MKYVFTGEEPVIIPNTLDGPRVLDPGDTVSMPDDDYSLDDNPRFKAARGYKARRNPENVAAEEAAAGRPSEPEPTPEPDSTPDPTLQDQPVTGDAPPA